MPPLYVPPFIEVETNDKIKGRGMSVARKEEEEVRIVLILCQSPMDLIKANCLCPRAHE